MRDTLFHALKVRAVEEPEKGALVGSRQQVYSYLRVFSLCTQMAQKLKERGIGPGERVYLGVPPGEDLIFALLALSFLGAQAVVLEPSLEKDLFLKILEKYKIQKGVFMGLGQVLPWLRPGLRQLEKITLPPGRSLSPSSPVVDFSEDLASDVCLVTFTSGTTGLPKPRMRTQEFLLRQSEILKKYLPSQPALQMVFLPNFILHNLRVCTPSLIPDFFPYDILKFWKRPVFRQLLRHKPQSILASPGVFHRLGESKGMVFPFVKRILTGGGQVSPGLLKSMFRQFPQASVEIVYGSTEVEPIAHILGLQFLEYTSQPGVQGLPLGKIDEELEFCFSQGGEMSTNGPGELWVRGPQVNPLVPEDLWSTWRGKAYYRTGDLAHMDSRGCLWFLGRKGDEILLPNRVLYPFSLEQKLERVLDYCRVSFQWIDGAGVLAVQGQVRKNWLPLIKKELRGEGLSELKVVFLSDFPLDPRHRTKIQKGKVIALMEKKMDQGKFWHLELQ